MEKPESWGSWLARDFETKLERALSLELGYEGREGRERPTLGKGTPAAVALIFGRHEPGPADPSGLSLLLTRRTDTVETHKGQMAFPGGRADEEDTGNPVTTALRETEEEVGIDRGDLNVVGTLPPLDTVTGFTITPVAGMLKKPVGEVLLTTSAHEIAEAFWVPLDLLSHPDTYRREMMPFGAVRYPVDVYQIGPHRVWGATASMIKNLLDRLRSLR